MFDKNKFAQILKNINDTYISQRDFAKKSEINRTYLSQYMNMKLNEPPKPKILRKLAEASNNIVTYNELMETCGYINDNYFINLQFQKDKLKETESYYIDKLVNYNISKDEQKIYNDLMNIINFTQFYNLSDVEIDNELHTYFNNMDYINDKSKKIILDKIKLFNKYHTEIMKIEKEIFDIEYNKNKNNVTYSSPINTVYTNKLFNIPVLSKIVADKPTLADEYLEGYLPVDPKMYGMTTANDYFYLKVLGESMNLKVHNGDYALIHQQIYAENGDIIVAIVNGDNEATIKRYKKLNDQFILLEPMSTDPTIESRTIDLKNSKFQIIGKAIGQFGKF